MSKKTYLSNQIKLITLNTYDLFTPEEFNQYRIIVKCKAELGKADDDRELKRKLLAAKKAASAELNRLIASNKNIVRQVNPCSVCDTNSYVDGKAPDYICWDNLKFSRKITEFVSDQSRAMGLKPDDVTLDKIILSWRSLDVLEQVVLHGFTMKILDDDGNIVSRHYRFQTASAGQLRTDKVQILSDDIWLKIKDRMQCGMDWETINQKGGINANKLMAYEALASSATDPWDFPVDKCIVVRDFEAPVSAVMDYVKPGYKIERDTFTVLINHCDGCGMALPGTLPSPNVMVRGPYLKGLLTSFDFIKFCRVNGLEPKIKDVWGLEHDLIAEDIKIIFTESQLKLWKYYDSWEHYKRCFNECRCNLSLTNYEEKYIADTTINYQMLQTLIDLSDDEIKSFTRRTKERINGLATDKESMLATLGASENSADPYLKALYIYPELLRDGYAKEAIKSIKQRMLLDAKSGSIYCENKRLFAIPDMYAACEFWFGGISEPVGLIPDGCVYSPLYKNIEELDILRSPHLYMEHAVRRVCDNAAVREWFTTGGIYTSVHDPISRILQFDNDGDQLNCVANAVIIEAAKRNIKSMDVVPLFYDAYKADKEILSNETMFNALKRAHEYSGIGKVSNSLTKLWNSDNPDVFAAACLCRFNNAVIDAAKCGKIDSYENYPEINKRVMSAIGGKRAALPYFFQFSKNGRRDNSPAKTNCAPKNNSAVNRICGEFEGIGRLNFHMADVAPFDFRMLLSEDDKGFSPEVVEAFIVACSERTGSNIAAENALDLKEKSKLLRSELLTEHIAQKIESVMPLSEAYKSIVKYLFVDDNFSKVSLKQEFWRVFGDIALQKLEANLSSCNVCPRCKTKYPLWADRHICPRKTTDFIECCDCGALTERLNSRQSRCPDCQKEYRRLKVAQNVSKFRSRRKAA